MAPVCRRSENCISDAFCLPTKKWVVFCRMGRGESAVAFLEMFAKTVAGLLLPQMPRNHFLRLRRRHRKLQHVAVYAHNRKKHTHTHGAYAVNATLPHPSNCKFRPAHRLANFQKKKFEGERKLGTFGGVELLLAFPLSAPPPPIFALFL